MKKLVQVFVICLTLAPSAVFGWCHSLRFPQEEENSLTNKVLKNSRINYCLNIEKPDRYPVDDIAFQTELALKLWLEPVTVIQMDKIAIKRKNCDEKDIDLIIKIGNIPGETAGVTLRENSIAKVLINAEDWTQRPRDPNINMATEGNIQSFPNLNFQIFLGSAPDVQRNVLEKLVRDRKETVNSFAQSRGLPLELVRASTFPLLLHELGHTFGLGDTYGQLLTCEQNWTRPIGPSNLQPEAVMKRATFFSLAPDDEEGIRSIFERLKSKLR